MNKELINTLEELSNKSTTELALNIMELTTNNLIKEQELKEAEELVNINEKLSLALESAENKLDKIKNYINENEVCLIKNGIPEIKRSELIKLLEE